jgi:hypothetical protein
MRVTTVDNITREDNSEYSKIEFDTKHVALLNKGETRFTVLTPKGRKANDKISYDAIKAINAYYDQFLN